MIALNENKTMIQAKPTSSPDILDRILNAVVIIQSEGYIVKSANCGGKVFEEIARRFAPQLGYIEKEQFFIGPNKILLFLDKHLIYSEEKQFYLKITDKNGKEGLLFPTFVKTLNKLETKNG